MFQVLCCFVYSLMIYCAHYLDLELVASSIILLYELSLTWTILFLLHLLHQPYTSCCLYILPKNRRGTCNYVQDCRFSINTQQIDNVESFKHLGHVISSQMEDASDIIGRRNDFVGQVNNLLCYFRKLTPCIK